VVFVDSISPRYLAVWPVGLRIFHFFDRKIGPGMVWYGMVNVDLYSAIITKVSNALNTLVSGEKPGIQSLTELTQ